MTRTLLCVAAALAFAVSLPAYHNRAAAQESADAGAEATADSSQSADASADASGSADAQSSNAQADSGSAQSSSSDAASSSDQSSQSDQSTQSDSPSLPPPSAETDTQTDAKADANATQDTNQSQPSQDQPSNRSDANETDASARDRVDAQTDARVRGRARGDAQARGGRQQDVRRGIRFGRTTDRGLTVNFIQRNSMFFDSGLRQGDIIVSLHGRRIRNEADFMRWVLLHPGQRAPVIVLRGGRQETIYITYPQEVVRADQPYDQAGGQAYLGVGFDARVRNAAMVRTVTPGSPAEQAGLQPGDEIVALNNQEVRSHQDAIAIIRSMRPGDRLNIAFARRIANETEAVLAGRPGEPVRTATYEPEIRVERRPLPPQDNRRVDVDVDTRDDRPIQDRDRDADGDEEKPLLQRIFD